MYEIVTEIRLQPPRSDHNTHANVPSVQADLIHSFGSCKQSLVQFFKTLRNWVKIHESLLSLYPSFILAKTPIKVIGSPS